MTKKEEEIYREQIHSWLILLPEDSQNIFLRMYGSSNDPLDIVVKNMPSKKLKWALQQVERTVEKLNIKTNLILKELVD